MDEQSGDEQSPNRVTVERRLSLTYLYIVLLPIIFNGINVKSEVKKQRTLQILILHHH